MISRSWIKVLLTATALTYPTPTCVVGSAVPDWIWDVRIIESGWQSTLAVQECVGERLTASPLRPDPPLISLQSF